MKKQETAADTSTPTLLNPANTAPECGSNVTDRAPSESGQRAHVRPASAVRNNPPVAPTAYAMDGLDGSTATPATGPPNGPPVVQPPAAIRGVPGR